MSLITPFNTFFTPEPSMTAADVSAEIAKLWRRQTAIDALLHGEVDDDVVYDLLAEDGIDPYKWEEVAIENIEILTGEKV